MGIGAAGHDKQDGYPKKTLFLHGWRSVPGGVKPTYLVQHGHEVINPALDGDDFDEAVRTAEADTTGTAPT